MKVLNTHVYCAMLMLQCELSTLALATEFGLAPNGSILSANDIEVCENPYAHDYVCVCVSHGRLLVLRRCGIYIKRSSSSRPIKCPSRLTKWKDAGHFSILPCT